MLKLDHHVVTIPIETGMLTGFMSEPRAGQGFVLFAHGSGSSRLSPRNRFVAEQLEAAGLGTLLFDLLTEEEDQSFRNRFEIPLLADRLTHATQWVRLHHLPPSTPVGLFGASTGAAAALVAAASPELNIRAVVSRGGRPDLAHEKLHEIHSPTLLIVGEFDTEVIELNREAMEKMPETTVKSLEIVPRAAHLFEEPGAMESVAHLARDWFTTYLK